MNEIEAKNYFKNFWKKHTYKIIEFRDEKWKYIISGKKDNPPIILIHGGFVDAGMWAYQVQDLEKDFKVLAPTFSSPPRSFRLYCDIIDFQMQKEMIEKQGRCVRMILCSDGTLTAATKDNRRDMVGAGCQKSTD